MKIFQLSLLAIALCLFLSAGVATAATIIDDFSGGVANSPDDPEGVGVFGHWYDITGDTFGTPSAGTLSGSPAMNIVDGGFTNGVYAIYQAVVPANGVYTLSADILFNDTATNGTTQYQVGAVVNGVHRDPNPSDLAHPTNVGNYTGLTAGALDATVIQTVTTTTFAASAGDDILVAFSTALDQVNYDEGSGFWNGATVDVDNIMLNLIPEPASFALAMVAGFGLAFGRSRRR